MRKIMADYAANGVPAELVEAAKRREIAGVEFRRNSIPGLASAWSESLAAEGRNSPDEDVEAMKRVTTEDVNRVAKEFLTDKNSITAQLKPVPSGAAVAAKGFGGDEQLTSAPTKPVELPSWAASRLLSLELPPAPSISSDMTLPNGLRLVVKTEKTTPTVSILGEVRQDPQMETPAGKEGAATFSEIYFPTARRVSIGWLSRKLSTTSPPTSRRASVFRCTYWTRISRAASNCWRITN